jgi:glycosyltransferase 2 family protein
LTKRFALGVGISAILLLALYQFYKNEVQFDDLVGSFADASLLLVVIVVVMHLGVLSLKAVRWNVVLGSVPHEHGLPKDRGPEDKAARWLVFDALFLGYFGNYVLPAKLGELGRSLLYSRRAKVPFPAVLATIVFERFVDAATLIVFFYVTLLFLPESLPDWVGLSARLVGIASIVGFAGLWVMWRRLPKEGSGEGLMGKLAGIASTFRDGLSVMQNKVVAAKAVGWTVAIWALECVSVWICILAFGFQIEALWTAAVLQVVISSFAIAAPSAPAGLGIHQWVSLLILSEVFAVPKDDALAISLLVTGAVIVWTVPLGLFGLFRQGASLAELRGDLDSLADHEPPPEG